MSIKRLFLASTLVVNVLSAIDVEVSVGTHDFIVSNIVDDVSSDGISVGSSHTLGINAAISAKHKTESGISFLAKAEVFLDRDTDHLDPDHIPIWFDFLFSADGMIHKINETNILKWYILMDNRQNTVSCIEREVRQHGGVGYQYDNHSLEISLNAYLGFYYIEFDDDTPVARAYTRQDTDDGEASNMIELTVNYTFSKSLALYTQVKRYSANGGFERLEDNVNLLVSYQSRALLGEGSSINIQAKYASYDLERFYRPSVGVPIVPFDNDTLVQAYVSLPLKF